MSAAPSWRIRHDIELDSAYNLVLAQMHDGEMVVALIGRDGGGQWKRVGPWARVEVSDLMDVLDDDAYPIDLRPLRITRLGEFACVRIGKEGANLPVAALKAKVEAFLHAAT